MKTMRAKALASLLAGFVTLAGFSGCHASSAAMFSESATISASSAPQDSASSTTQIPQTSEAGTYVQDDMTELMPQTYAYFTDLRLSADGAVEVVGLSQSGGVQLLRWTEDVWETAVESGQPTVANRALTVAADGTLWTVCRDDSGAYTLQSGTDPAAMQTIPVEALSQEEALPISLRLAADGTLWTVCRDDSGAYTLQSGTDPAAMQTIPVEALSQEEALPISLRLAADGKIFLTAQVGETTVFVLVDPATRQATTVTPGFYGSPAFYAEGSIYTFAAGSTSLSVLDATNGRVLQQYSLPLAEPLARASAAAIQQNCLIWADSNGIHQIALGGTLQQNLADNRSFALASSSFIVQQIVLDGQGNYWVSGVNAGGQAQIYRYRYDTQAAVASGGELVVWAMEDSLLLRETVNTYASEHPEQTVTVEYGQDSLDNGMTVDDVIRTLNVEIFAGEGPDVLVLDGLPVESYIRQGILADLSNIDTSNCYENIVHCYADESGCWALPLLFRPSLVYCQSEENKARLSEAQNLTDLQDLLCVKSNFHYDGYYNLFSELYPAASASIFAVEGEGVNEDALREFLSVTKAVVDAQQISAEYDPLFGDGEDTASGDDGQHLAVDIPVSMNWYGRAQDPADCAAGNPSDYLLTYIYMVSETGSVPALIRPLPGDVFTPVMTMGVLNTSDQVDAGVAFVGTMLDCETEDLAGRGSFNGYFVRQGVQLAKVSQRYDGTDGNPTPSELNLDAVMAQLTTPSNTDLSLRELVYENAAQLYTGVQDLETTVANILQRTDLYYAEQQ